VTVAIRRLSSQSSLVERHATAREYEAFLRPLPRGEGYKRQLLKPGDLCPGVSRSQAMEGGSARRARRPAARQTDQA